MIRRKKSYAIVVVLLMVVVMFSLSACERKEKSADNTGAEQQMSDGSGQSRSFLGAVKALDTNAKIITLYNINLAQEVMLNYTGGTSFLSKSGAQMAAGQLQPGEVVDVYMATGTERPEKIQITSDAFQYDKVQNVVVNSNDSYIMFGDKKYKYGTNTVVISQGVPVDMMEITSTDVVTARGTEGMIYSLVVTAGHGYIRPENYAEFMGGKMTIDGETIVDITKNMLLPIREGTYDITMKKGSYIGTRSVTVERNKEALLDMSQTLSQPENTGQVVFEITPEGAEVYVDKKEVEYDLPVSLTYGKHEVSVILEGYTTYAGTLEVLSANPTVRIDLAKEEADIEAADEEEEGTKTTESDTAVSYDGSHTITVSEPAEAEVYFDGVYKGKAPVSFRKATGSHTITLSRSGYVTKSYAVEMLPDDEDVTWKFSDLKSEKDNG